MWYRIVSKALGISTVIVFMGLRGQDMGEGMIVSLTDQALDGVGLRGMELSHGRYHFMNFLP